MRLGTFLVVMPLPIAVAVYTASFGLWLLRRGNTRGSVGVFVVSAACVAIPLLLIIARG